MTATHSTRRAARRPQTTPLRLLPVAFAAALVVGSTSLMAQPATNALPVLNGAAPRVNASIGAQTGTGANPIMNITQTNARGVLEWNAFDIGANARVNIAQPNAQSILINRVTPGNSTPSQIFGQLNANGRVFLINSAGVTFGANARVNVGSLVASTLDLAPSMVADGYALALNPQTNTLLFAGGAGRVDVQSGATITADPAGSGSIVLLGNQGVMANGTLTAVRGRIGLASGDAAQVVLPATDSGFIDLVVTANAKPTDLSVGTSGHLLAESGSIVLGGDTTFARTEEITIEGEVNAGSTVGRGGSVRVDAGVNGTFLMTDSGGINAASTAAGQSGGSIDVQGRLIDVATRGNFVSVPTFETATLNASGMSAGGRVTLGGDNTLYTIVGSGARVLADANGTGNGGTITIRANGGNNFATSPVARVDYGVTEVYGNLFARGGVGGGNGGTIETSGRALNLRLNDTQLGDLYLISTDARARHAGGTSGSWNIDPFNVTISNATAVAVNGTWSPTGPGANINAADINAALNAGTSVDINTGTTAVGAQTGNIDVLAGTTISRFNTGAPVSLTLRAHNDITFTGANIVTSSNLSTPINVNLFADLDGNGAGSVALLGGTSIATGGGNIVISGGVDPATGFARGTGQRAGITIDNSTISTRNPAGATTGNVTLRGSGGAGTSDNGITVRNNAGIAGNNQSYVGRSEQGTAVSFVDSDLSTDSGNIELRGVAVRATSLSTQSVGVDLSGVQVQLGGGSLLVAGRADDGTAPKTANPAQGVRYSNVEIRTSTTTTGNIAFAGQSVNSTAAGLTFTDVENGGLDIRAAGVSQQIPTLANVSLGAISSDGLALAVDPAGATSQVQTTGTINFRPVGVDVNGQVVEQPTASITIGTPGTGDTGFWVDPTAMQLGTTFSAQRGFSFGSSVHTGQIVVQNGALGGRTGQSYTLQNQGAGSQGIALGTNIEVRDLGLLSTGAVTQSANGAIAVARDLVIQGGNAGSVVLTEAGNTVGGNVAFAGPNRVDILLTGPMTVGNNTPLAAYDASTGSYAPVSLTSSLVGTVATLRADGIVTVNHGIASSGAGQIDLVSPTSVNAGTQAINPNGGYARAWAPAVTGLAGRLNLYGCVYPACTLSGVVPPPTGLQALFPTRPTVTVTADAQSGTTGSPIPPLTYTNSGLINGDTAAQALAGTLATGATPQSEPGLYAITQGTLLSPTGYLINYVPANVTLAAGTTVPPVVPPSIGPRDPVRTSFLAEYRSDVYGRNLALPFICTAASVVRDSVARNVLSDPLASEWGKVRNQPQLSGCLDVSSGGQCSAF